MEERKPDSGEIELLVGVLAAILLAGTTLWMCSCSSLGSMESTLPELTSNRN